MPVDKFGRMSDTKTKDTGVSLTYINNNYVRSDGETPLTGSLNMRGNTIYNVADPVNPQDVVTKVYVDNTKGSGVIGRKTKDGVSIKENLDFLGKQKIKNLPDPVDEKDVVTKKYVDDKDVVTKKYVDDKDAVTKKYVDDKDAVTKEYVDDKTKNLFIDKNDNIAFGLNVDMENNKIFGLPEPVEDQEAATKKYVDDLQTQYIDKRGNVKFDRNINVGNNRIFALKDPKKDYEATNKKYVDDTINKRLQEEKDTFLPQDPATKEYVDEAIKQLAGGDILVSKEGVFIKANGHYRATAPLDIDNHKMENLREPLEDGDAVNKKYVDGIVEDLTLKQGLIRENGGFNLVDSYINMNFNNVRNLGLPKNENDGVPRKFVDDMIKEVEEKINKRKQLIAVHASYCGPLKKGDYPFKFSGNNLKFCDEKIEESELFKPLISGFVMPHSGYIQKIICEGLAYINLKTITEDIINSLGKDDIDKLKLHYKKDDFKNDFKYDLIFKLNFNILPDNPIKDKKSFFKIIKTKKKFVDIEDKKIFLTGDFLKDLAKTYFKVYENQKAIINNVLIEKFELIQTIASKDKTPEIHEVKLIMQISSNEVIRLENGETLNIQISDFQDDLFLKEDILNDILKPAVMVLFSKLNFNFTFLIELDPL